MNLFFHAGPQFEESGHKIAVAGSREELLQPQVLK